MTLATTATRAPASEEELADTVRAAAAASRPLAIEGGATRGLGHPVAGDRLATAGLAGISLYEPGALTLVAGAGTPLAEVEAALAAEGQCLPFEPWDARALTGANGTPTVGGMVATNASGPRRIQAGAARDSLIGVRFVDGTGAVVKNGGRVMKNVTGLDLVKLMAGSHGTLGVLTEVAFKVLPRPETTVTLVLDGLADATAGRAMTRALATPFQVSAAAHHPGALAKTLADIAPSRLEEGEGDWAAVRDAAAFAGRDGAVWRVSVKPTDGPALGARLAGAELLYDWGGGLVWVLAPETLDLRAAMAGLPGHATLVRASDDAKRRLGVFHPEPAPVAVLSAGLRSRFDPMGILNPGRMG